MKYTPIVFLVFWSCSYLYSMELELDLVPLLEKKSVDIQKKGFFADNYKPSGYGCLPEKLYLARRLPGLITPKNMIRKKIIEYMIQAESKLDYEISLHYQTKISLLHKKIDELTSQKNNCSNVKIDVNRCIDGAYGAAAGGCCGAAGGMGIACFALAIKAYVWLWCDPRHNPIVCDALLWGFPICTGAGCVCGVCIGASGLYGKIEWV